MGHTLCEGEFVSRRSFESIWASDACIYNCLAHSIFNLTSPKSSPGVFAVNDTAKVVDVRVVNTSSDVVYIGHEFGCQRIPSNKRPTVPVYVDDGSPWAAPQDWPEATATNGSRIAGVDYDGLNRTLSKYFEDPALVNGAHTKAIVVIYQGKLIAEQYSEALDISAATASISWSLAKSVTSALIGIRSGMGGLSVRQRATTPAWNASEIASRNITLDDLLRMVSGIDWNESGAIDTAGSRYVPINDVAQMLYEAPNAAAFVGMLPQNATPGTYWNYSTGNFQVVQYNLRRSFTSDSAYWSFAVNRLFKKIGARSFAFEADPSGTLLGGSHAFATARDWARFGQLFLQDGMWNGVQVLPEGWVQYSTTPTKAFDKYGAGWWLRYPGAPLDSYYGNGLMGQRVIVSPSQDLVIVRLGLNYNDDFDQVYGQDFFGNISAALPASTTAASLAAKQPAYQVVGRR
ncbi:g7027 [Coccomyxa elongata]